MEAIAVPDGLNRSLEVIGWLCRGRNDDSEAGEESQTRFRTLYGGRDNDVSKYRRCIVRVLSIHIFFCFGSGICR